MKLSKNQENGLGILQTFLTAWIKRTSVEDFIKLKKEVENER